MSFIEVDCICGKSVPVEGIETTLVSEDYKPIEVKCTCGERYRVNLHMEFLGKGEQR